MKYVNYTLNTLIILFIVTIPMNGHAGVIRTHISSLHKFETPNDLDIHVDIQNKGDVSVYSISAAIIMAGWNHEIESLGDNPPNGTVRFSARHPIDPNAKPGNYTGIVIAQYEERSGRHHKAYHIFKVPYRIEQIKENRFNLDVQLDSPRFNLKTYWQPDGRIVLTFDNTYQTAIHPQVNIYLPIGFTTPESIQKYALSSKEKRRETIPLSMAASIRQGRAFHTVVWYEHNGIHHSRYILGRIRVEQKPVYFRLYITIAAITSIILFVIIYYRRRRTFKPDAPSIG